MEYHDFYKYDENKDNIKIYSDEFQEFFLYKFNILINSIDFDSKLNVVLYIEDIKSDISISKLEKIILNEIEHLNDVEIKKTKIILTFDATRIELC
jgi:hypothetical protein